MTKRKHHSRLPVTGIRRRLGEVRTLRWQSEGRGQFAYIHLDPKPARGSYTDVREFESGMVIIDTHLNVPTGFETSGFVEHEDLAKALADFDLPPDLVAALLRVGAAILAGGTGGVERVVASTGS